MEIIKKIIILNKRSQFAYNEYVKRKKYYQAKRIFNANEELLALLKEFQFLCDPELLECVFKYICHLDDWFLQFKEAERKIENITDEFVFTRLEYSFKFPNDFYQKIENN
jgi:hypothetical protein